VFPRVLACGLFWSKRCNRRWGKWWSKWAP
jgi:hypothetical protein